MKKTKWRVLFFVGMLPFLMPLYSAFGASYFGVLETTSGGSLLYGFSAFRAYLLVYSYRWWPTYVIGLILIIWSVIRLADRKS